MDEESAEKLNDVVQAEDGDIFGDVDKQSLTSNDKNQKTKYVHIIPHSHDDLGWQGTIEDYF